VGKSHLTGGMGELQMPVLTVPRRMSDLTAGWLSEALAGVADGAQATDLFVVPIGLGHAADTVRLVPIWDRPTAAPASVVAKVPSSDEASRLRGFASRSYEREVAFYKRLAGTVWVSRPMCYLAHYDFGRECYVVLLEDMAPAAAADPMAGCTPQDAASVMPELAALHAPRWGDPALLDIAQLERPTSDTFGAAAQLLTTEFADFVDQYRERLDPAVVPLAERLMSALGGYLTDRPGPWTVLHGDFRLENVLFGHPRVTVVDWQTTKIGPGLSDVAGFIGSALAPDVRLAHELELVRTYHWQLATGGVDLAWDECWDGYRRYSLDGLMAGMAAAMRGAQSERSDDVLVSMVNRHARQATDLGAQEFLEA
jgi:Ecdysteroid kinase-like family